MRRRRNLTKGVEEQQAGRHATSCPGFQARHHTQSQQRIAAEIEEVIARTDTINPQQLAPDVCNQLFQAGGGWLETITNDGRIAERIGQGPRIELAVWCQRQCVQRNEHDRQHIIGQGQSEMATCLAGCQFLPGPIDDIGNQPRLLCIQVLCDYGGTGNGRVRKQRGLNLAELDSKAAQLDLPVEATQVIQTAIVAPAAQIALYGTSWLRGGQQTDLRQTALP